MNITREEVQQIITVLSASQEFVEASSNCKLRHGWGNQLDDAEKAISLLQSKLAEKDDGEPYRWLYNDELYEVQQHDWDDKPFPNQIPLFTHPAPKPMTESKYSDIVSDGGMDPRNTPITKQERQGFNDWKTP